MPAMIDQVRRLLAHHEMAPRSCLVCHGPIRADEQQMRVHGEAYVHSRCATYRMRQLRDHSARLGYPPR